MQLISREVRIENTAMCNARCSICPREKMTRPLVTMPVHHFKYLVDQAKAIGAETISVFGHGEPLMDRQLGERIKYCTDNGLKTFITTNAGLLTAERTHELLAAGLSHIRFSAHGIGIYYEAVHRGLSWDAVRRNIKNFLVSAKAAKAKIETSVSVIPMHGESVSSIRSFWEPQIDYLEIWKPHNWTEGRNYRWLKVAHRKPTCGRPASGPVQIQADGKMIVCCFDFDGKLVMGDTYQNTIEDILKCNTFDRIREQHKTGDHRGTLCASCDQLNIEEDNPLLYSSRDKSREIGKTSSTKFKLKEN